MVLSRGRSQSLCYLLPSFLLSNLRRYRTHNSFNPTDVGLRAVAHRADIAFQPDLNLVFSADTKQLTDCNRMCQFRNRKGRFEVPI